MKLKDDKTCFRHDHADATVRKPCRFGLCTILLCDICGLRWADWGPVDCPCKKNENGTLRWLKYPDMDTKSHVAVKENTMGNRKRKPFRAWRDKAEF